MAITIYDKAKKVHKDGTVFYLLKFGSKNCFTCPNQYLVDNNLRTKWTQRETRDSDWSAIAKRPLTSPVKMADTYWNASTGDYYGKIQFGNKRNIALYLDRAPVVDYYADLDEEQQRNFDQIVAHSAGVDQKYRDSLLDLENIPEEKQMRVELSYCGNVTKMNYDNTKQWNGKNYWDLDNL